MARKPASWHWSQDVHKIFRDIGIKQVAYVPDNGLAKLIERCNADKAIRSVVLTTEEEGVAQVAGAWLGGQRAAFLTQSGGVGNCINMLSMMQECRIPMFSMVSMRGEWGETYPWQIPMGQATVGALQNAGVIVQHVDDAERLPETVEAAAKLAFDGMRGVSVIVGQWINQSGGRG